MVPNAVDAKIKETSDGQILTLSKNAYIQELKNEIIKSASSEAITI